MKRSLAFVSVFFLLTTSSCAKLWVKEGETNEGEVSTTAVSTATGAAIGAGLGAIIGSTTGSAGGGLAIGAGAGALTGAAIGNQLERQEDKLENQKEILARQEEQIATQEREITELRQSIEDIFPNNRASGMSPKKSMDSYRGNPGALPYKKAEQKDYRARLESIKSDTPKPKAKLEQRVKKVDAPKKEKQQVAKLTEPKKSEAQKTAQKIPSKTEVKQPEPVIAKNEPAPIISEPKKTEPVASAPEVITVGGVTEQNLVAETKPSEQAVAATELPPAKKVSAALPTEPIAQDDCSEAVQEAKLGDSAVSDSDKLFYYTRAAKLCPAKATYRVKVGQVYASIGKKKEAEREFKKALDVDPNDLEANEELSLLEIPQAATKK